MTNLWRGLAAAAIVSGALAGCASPHYPIRADQAPGPAPLSAPQPKYPITPQAAPPQAAAATAPDSPAAPPAAAPVAPVQSEPLPPPTAPAAAQAAAPTAAAAPDTGPPANAAQAEPAAPPASTPSPSAATSAPPSEPATTPRMVAHDQGAPSAIPAPATRVAYAPPPRPTERDAIAGEVVDAGGGIFENYEVRRGDHIDALARGFGATRDVLVDANHLRAPYRLRPGEILKVPVAKAYVAEGGDTLSGVARRFSVEAGELAEINHLTERAALRDGQKIGLPSSMRDRGPLRGHSEYAEASPRMGRAFGYVVPAVHPGLTPLYAAPAVPDTQAGAPRSVGYATATQPNARSEAAATTLSDSDISAAAKGRFVWPVRGDIVGKFGPAGVGRRNDGVDIKAAQGSAVMAAAPGEVVYAGDQVPGFGNLVLIKHADGWVTAYAHLDQVQVQMKDEVMQGQTVGTVGATGGAPAPELHFEVRYAPSPADKARPVDPALVLPRG